MIKRLLGNGPLLKLITCLDGPDRIVAYGLDLEARFLVLKEIDHPIMYITSDDVQANKICDLAERVGYRSAKVVAFDYDYSIVASDEVRSNADNIARFNCGQTDFLCVSAGALLSKYPGHLSSLEFGVDEAVRPNLEETLSSLGYSRTSEISGVGDYFLLGERLDISTPGGRFKIDFDFDTVSKITSVNGDPLHPDRITIPALSVLGARDIDFDRLLSDLKRNKGTCDIDAKCKELENLRELNIGDIPYLFPYSKVVDSTIFDLVRDDCKIVVDDYKQVYETMQKYLQEEKDVIKNNRSLGLATKLHESALFSIEDVRIRLSKTSVVGFGIISSNNRLFDATKLFSIHSSPVINYASQLKMLACDISRTSGYTYIIFCDNVEFAKSISGDFDRYRIPYEIVGNLAAISKGTVNLVTKYLPLSSTFDADKLCIIGTNHILSDKKISFTHDDYTVDLPKIGDYVVHSSYGIGRLVESKMIDVGGTQKEYFVIEYKGSDKLYLPCEYIDRITKYIGGDPKLNKLGSGDFLRTKESVKKSLKALAFDLREVYRARTGKQGIVIPRQAELEEMIASTFPYDETADQLQAISDVYSDMASGKIMDRLVCGDVGYGKTEVAIRAIFRTIMAGYQALFMCPTTILAVQHYNTCRDRLAEFGMRVEMLSRYVPAKKREEIYADFRAGKIDLLCGTHSLLSDKIEAKNLGLLVLDEEQKFGVGDKEKIKNIKSSINVLTLSATPIPRTLHMSLVGIRDISIIGTPPFSRLNCITSVTGYSDALLKNAIMREVGRGGQILVVYNRVEKIYAFASHVRELLDDPNITIGVAHGRLDEKESSAQIYDLYSGKTKVFIATTIIENGIDLPNANTLFVIDSDRLGLAQLYQLKGRVGRSNIQAYAYFTYNEGSVLGSDAYKRLESIMQYSDLGSGYKIAMRDLEIRGAGDIFGAEQSGHMGKVGYNMYVTLLGESIAELDGKAKVDTECEVETDIEAVIPTYYLSSTLDRVYWYNQISGISDDEGLNKVYKAMVERVGPVPAPVKNIMLVAMLKNISSRSNIKKVIVNNSKCEMQFTDLSSMQDFYLAHSDSPISIISDVGYTIKLESNLPRLEKIIELLKLQGVLKNIDVTFDLL